MSPQAQALLNLYPLPNLAGNSQYNYETGLLNSTHADALQSRLDKAIGRRDEFYGGFGFQNIRADNLNLFHFQRHYGHAGARWPRELAASVAEPRRSC